MKYFFFWLIVINQIFVFAQTNPVIFAEDQEVILSVKLDDGTIVSEGLSAYRKDLKLFLPVGQLFEILGVQANQSVNLKKIEGNFLAETRAFAIDLQNCSSMYQEKKLSFDCQSLVVQDDEFFAEMNTLMQILPMSIKFDSFASTITINSVFRFPVQEKKDRELNAGKLNKQDQNKSDQEIDIESIPTKTFAGPVVDQQLGIEKNQAGEQTTNWNTVATSEVFGWQSKTQLTGVNDSTQLYQNFAKKDPQGKIFKNFKIREVQLWDLPLVQVPLVSGVQLGKGIFFSSYPLNQPASFATKDFVGNMAAGWEVELYQNDNLIARQDGPTDNQYKFLNIPLNYGVNRFVLIFYGPLGQKREEVQTVNVGGALTPPNEHYYRVGIVQGQNESESQYMTAQASKGFTESFSLQTNYWASNKKLEESATHYLDLGLFSSIWGSLVSINVASNSKSQSAGEIGLQAPLSRGSFGVSAAHVKGFQSEIFNTKKVGQISQEKYYAGWSFEWPVVFRMMAEVVHNTYEEFSDKNLNLRTSWNTGSVAWFNNLAQDLGESKTTTGELSLVTVLKNFEIRPFWNYIYQEGKSLSESYGASVQRKFANKLTAELSLKDFPLQEKNETELQLSKSFTGFALGLSGMQSSSGDYKVAGNLFFSSFFDSQQGKISLDSEPLAETGLVSILAFYDANQNSKFDLDEEPIKNLSFLVNSNELPAKTNDSGVCTLRGLPVNQILTIEIAPKSLIDPNLRPVHQKVNIVARTGHVLEIAMPLEFYQDIEGFVQKEVGAQIKGKGRIDVTLFNEKGELLRKTKTESDGYFYFDKIPKGKYRLALDPDQLSKLQLKARLMSVDIEVKNADEQMETVVFSLE